jgi:hypothetical protein
MARKIKNIYAFGKAKNVPERRKSEQRLGYYLGTDFIELEKMF